LAGRRGTRSDPRLLGAPTRRAARRTRAGAQLCPGLRPLNRRLLDWQLIEAAAPRPLERAEAGSEMSVPPSATSNRTVGGSSPNHVHRGPRPERAPRGDDPRRADRLGPASPFGARGSLPEVELSARRPTAQRLRPGKGLSGGTPQACATPDDAGFTARGGRRHPGNTVLLRSNGGQDLLPRARRRGASARPQLPAASGRRRGRRRPRLRVHEPAAIVVVLGRTGRTLRPPE